MTSEEGSAQYGWAMTSGISAVALTGTIGAGKTTVAEAISEELHERNIRHALLDLDWLGQVYPVPEGHEPYGYERFSRAGGACGCLSRRSSGAGALVRRDVA